jgi:hypothetical protein
METEPMAQTGPNGAASAGIEPRDRSFNHAPIGEPERRRGASDSRTAVAVEMQSGGNSED